MELVLLKLQKRKGSLEVIMNNYMSINLIIYKRWTNAYTYTPHETEL